MTGADQTTEASNSGSPGNFRLSEGLGCNLPAPGRERPILFSAPMVRVLLAGTKTQTRRAMRVQPHDGAEVVADIVNKIKIDRHGDEQPGPDKWGAWWSDGDEASSSPYGGPGDRLWVRETWARDEEDGALIYRADVGAVQEADDWERSRIECGGRYRWRPSIFMPRRASRITLSITGMRVERLNDISRGDAMSEGCPFQNMAQGLDPRQWYADLWEQINGPGSWSANQWVWVLEFQRCPALQPNVVIQRTP